MQSPPERRDVRTPHLDALRIVAAVAVVLRETPIRHSLNALFDRRAQALLAVPAATPGGESR